MRILMIHERYRQPGGEDTVFETEAALLEAHGCVVERLVADNRSIDEDHNRLKLAVGAVWSAAEKAKVQAVVRRFRPDVAHVHNWFPLLSPAIHGAIRAEGVPVVQTLHNFRLMCLNGLFFRDGTVCDACSGARLPWRGVLRRCYRGHLGASATVAAMITAHRLRGTWQRDVDLFLALNEFSRRQFIAAGVPAEKLAVKSNVIADPGVAAAAWDRPRAGAVFVGRLSPEKGIRDLVAGWQNVGHRLTVIGTGPLEDEIRALASPEVDVLGWCDPARVSSLLAGAAVVCVPSRCYEQAPMALLEATAHGVPVLVADVGIYGALAEREGFGLAVPVADPQAWRRQAIALLQDPVALAAKGHQARRWYHDHCSPAVSARVLLGHYHSVRGDQSVRGGAR